MTPKEILKRLFQYARPYAGYLIGGLLCAVASIALTLLGPVLIGKAIDQIVGPGQPSRSCPWALSSGPI